MHIEFYDEVAYIIPDCDECGKAFADMVDQAGAIDYACDWWECECGHLVDLEQLGDEPDGEL
jgi:hypothetical protein